MSKFWRGMVGVTLFLVIAFTGRTMFDDELSQDVWVMASGAIGLVLSIGIHWVVTHLRGRRPAKPAGR